jgi:hypothetical protein
MEFVAEPWVGRRLFHSYSSREGIGDIKPLLKYFIALYYRQGGGYLLYVYTQSLYVSLIPSAASQAGRGVYKIKGSFA